MENPNVNPSPNPNPYTANVNRKRSSTGSTSDVNVELNTSKGSHHSSITASKNIMEYPNVNPSPNPNPYTASVNRKRSSTGSTSDVNGDLNTSKGSHHSSITGYPSTYANRGYKASNRSSVYVSQDIHPENGCVLLGRTGTSGNKYTTRFKVNYKTQQKLAQKGVVGEECCTCIAEENRETLFVCIRSFIQAEAFLLTLHLAALTLGVVKTSIKREEIDEDIELIHTILETLVVIFVLTARILMVRGSYSEIKECIRRTQHVEIGFGESLIESKIRRIVNIFTGFCIFMMLFVIMITLILHFFVHLGWTTLTNNATLVIVTALSNVILVKINKIKKSIVEDQHKIVLYEAALLLKEGATYSGTDKKGSYIEKMTTFVKALLDTDVFEQPGHIELMDKYSPRWNTVTTMELMSAV